MSVLVKICGITTGEDAVLCARAGADRLGLIFAESPRRVDLEQARAIARAVPNTPLTGVFVGCDAAAVREAIEAADLSHVQVHGCADPAAWAELERACGRPVIPALRVGELPAAGELDDRHTVLLDLDKDPALRGAEHVAALQDAAAALVRRGIGVMLAGNLDPAGVARAVHRTGCLGVDVARGVESEPGRKDPDRVRRFVRAAHGVEFGHVH